MSIFKNIYHNLRVFVNRIFLILSIFTFVKMVDLHAQTGNESEIKKIEFLNADYSEYDKSRGIDAMRIIGKVLMRHEGTYMYADSAYRYMERNAFDAFGHIHIKQGDSLDIYGDTLKYDGQSGLAIIKGVVRMIDKEVLMKTGEVVYDLRKKTAYYPDRAVTRSGENILKSKKGYYNSDTKEFAFKSDVVIENPKYTVKSDTMHFNTVTETAFFFGPTHILAEENYIYCENGWYDTRRDVSSFNKNAYLQSKSQVLRGDSLYYERATGFGIAIKNITLVDSVENVEIRGNYAKSYRNIEKYIITDSLTLMMKSEKDTLFLSSDSLLATKDSICGRIINAYHRVKFFKFDFQGSCDSLSYITADSLLMMFRKPILWNEENQLTGKYIQINMEKGRIRKLEMYESAFIVSKEDSVMFNQISGKDMHAFFTQGELRKVDVYSNGQTIYYPQEDNGDYIGVNKADCTDMVIYMEDKKVARIVFKTKPSGELSPLQDVNLVEFKLKGFQWLSGIRPMSVLDIYSVPLPTVKNSIPAPPQSGKKKPGKRTN